MPDIITSNYFYGDEAMQFTYFRIPSQLISSPRFKHLSTDSKLLYGMLLDRMGLSIKNEWYDDDGRVYIYYTVDEICNNLNCGRDKAMKLLSELDTDKGIGLIERIRPGQGKPTRIYVKRFTTQEIPPQPTKKKQPSFARCAEVDFSDVQKSRKPTQIIIIKIKLILVILIHPPAPSARQMEIERCEVREEVEESIDYERLRQELPYDDVESLLELIVDVVSSGTSTMRIGGDVLPAEAVKQRFRQLESEHIMYVIDSRPPQKSMTSGPIC